MDRALIYDGQVPLADDLLKTNRNVLLGLGYFMQDILGINTVVNALSCIPTVPGSLNVNIGPGRIYSLQPVDSNAYSDVAADTTDSVIKQGINLATIELSCPAPTTAGTTIIYLIEGTYSEADTDMAVLPYYDEVNPASPFSGPANSGASQPTRRAGSVGLVSKPGLQSSTPAAPSVDTGYVPLYLVTVPFGTTAITGAMITIAPGAPFISGNQLSEATADARYLQLTGGLLTGSLTGTSAVFQAITVNGISARNASLLNTGTLLPGVMGTGAPSVTTFIRGDGTWAQVSFANLSGTLATGQVPLACVQQYQTALSIAWSQITGTKNADLVQGYGPAVAVNANSMVLRDANGYAYFSYINLNTPISENPVVSQILVINGSDSFPRKADAAWVLRQMILSSATTIQADPGGTPSLAPGQMAFYY